MKPSAFSHRCGVLARSLWPGRGRQIVAGYFTPGADGQPGFWKTLGFDPAPTFVRRQITGTLRDAFMHLVRNAIALPVKSAVARAPREVAVAVA